jgi:hypothetical protein
VNGSNGNYLISPIKPGTGSVSISVSDGEDSVSRNFNVSVSAPAPVNTPPAFSLPSLPDIEVQLGLVPATVTVSATDVDDDELTFSASSSTDAVTVSGGGTAGSFEFTPNRVGATVITITVSDGTASAQLSFGLTVTELVSSNQPPDVTDFQAGPDQMSTGEQATVSLSAIDADSDSLSYSGSSQPTGIVSVEGGVAHGTFNITALSAGSATVRIQVSDGKAAAVTRSYTVQVNSVPAPLDNPPTITSVEPASLSLLAGQSAVLTLIAADDRPGLQFQAGSSDPGIATVAHEGNAS